MSVGSIRANSRFTLSVVQVRSSLATAKRSSSYRVRSKARITRMPLSTSRVTWLTRSIFACIDLKSGIAERTTRPMKPSITGIETRMTAESGTLSRNAMMMPPIIIIGAETTTLSIIRTTIWTCWTSLVVLVMRDGVPKWFSSACEKSSTRRKRAPRTSRPNAIETLEP